MARFTFRLESVLRQREREEMQLQRDLAERRRSYTEIERELQHADQQVREVNQQIRDNNLLGRLDMSVLSTHRRYLAAMGQKVASIARRMAEARIAMETAQRKVADAARERKVIEQLREKQHTRWREDQSRRELSAADEVAMQMAFTGARV